MNNYNNINQNFVHNFPHVNNLFRNYGGMPGSTNNMVASQTLSQINVKQQSYMSPSNHSMNSMPNNKSPHSTNVLDLRIDNSGSKLSPQTVYQTAHVNTNTSETSIGRNRDKTAPKTLLDDKSTSVQNPNNKDESKKVSLSYIYGGQVLY